MNASSLLTLSLYDFLHENQDKIRQFLQQQSTNAPSQRNLPLMVDEAQISPEKLKQVRKLKRAQLEGDTQASSSRTAPQESAAAGSKESRASIPSSGGGSPLGKSPAPSSGTSHKSSSFEVESFTSRVVERVVTGEASSAKKRRHSSPQSPPKKSPSHHQLIPTFFTPSSSKNNHSAISFAKIERLCKRFGQLAYSNLDSLLELLEIPPYMKHTLWNSIGAFHSLNTESLTLEKDSTYLTTPSSCSFGLSQLKEYYNHNLKGKEKKERYFFIFKQDKANSRTHLIPSDFTHLMRDLIAVHPGLSFLNEHDSYKHFHSFYSKCVIIRIFYNIAKRGVDLISLRDFKKSNFVTQLEYLNETDNINTELSYFSYEHFYVLFCKLWELDTEHTYMLTREKLLQYSDYALTEKIINRVFDGYGRKVKCPVKDRFGYEDFIWFVLCEEDKTTVQSLEYWFRCVDIDADGIITAFEMEYFFKEQLERMALVQQEIVSFDDVYSQIIDMIKPRNPEFITLGDIKRSKMGHLFFNILFNLNKFLIFEQKAASMKWQDFAAIQYEYMMAAEEAAA